MCQRKTYKKSQTAREIKLIEIKIPKVRKIKAGKNNEFCGFLQKPDKNQKKLMMIDTKRKPLLIINPIFDNEINDNNNITKTFFSFNIFLNK